MPIYEYRCTKCNFEYEAFVLLRDEKVKCPKCGSEKVEKLISTTNLSGSIFSGSNSSCGSNSGGFS